MNKRFFIQKKKKITNYKCILTHYSRNDNLETIHQLLEPEIVFISVLKWLIAEQQLYFGSKVVEIKINWNYNFWEPSFSNAFSSESVLLNS